MMASARKRKPTDDGMVHYTGTISIGLVGCKREFEFEVDAGASEETIEEVARDAMFDAISWDYAPTEQKT